MLKKISDFLNRNINYVFIAPALIILLGIVIYPLIYNFNLSFHEVTMLTFRAGDWEFVGLGNFIDVVTDTFFQRAFLRTVLFLVFTVIGQVVIGLAGAMAFNVDFKGKKYIMPIALIPMMITPIAVGLIWKMFLNSQWGIVNYLFNLVGLPALNWLSEPYLAFVSIVIVQIWWGVSFVLLVLLGGLSSLPQTPFEAAKIDGASKFQMFRYITLPLLKPVILIVIMLRSIDAFRVFDIIYALTQGGPGHATRTFALELYYTAFERGEFGLGAAQALILAAVTLILASGLINTLYTEEV